jgi:hypothetical protein
MLSRSQKIQAQMMRFHARSVVAFLIASVAMLPAVAQTTPSHAPPNTPNIKRIAGTVARVDGNELLLKAKGGTTETYQLAPAAQLILAQPGTMSDLSTGKSVRCTSIYSQGAKVIAGECAILADNMHGFAGRRDVPDASNTPEYSGTITDVRDSAGAVQGKGRRILVRITDPQGETTMTVSYLTKISLIKAGDASILKVGAQVHGISQQAADGTGVLQVLTVVSNERGRQPSSARK